MCDIGGMRKTEFVRLVRELGRGISREAAHQAYLMALQINEESLPDDLPAAASRFVRLCERCKGKAMGAA